MNRLKKLRFLPAPTIQPSLVKTCPESYEQGYSPIDAVAAGIPTKPTFTSNLDQTERRKRAVIYMVRYNRIDAWMMACISNTGLPKPIFDAECEYYNRLRKDFQAMACSNAIPRNGKGSWFIQHVLWALSEADFKTHLHNLRVEIRIRQLPPLNEESSAKEARSQQITRLEECYNDHKQRWIKSLDASIEQEREILASLPVSNSAHLIKVREVRENIDRLIGFRDMAVGYDPIPNMPSFARNIPEKLHFYAERLLDEQLDFWTRDGICSRDILASFYAYADGIIDIKGCLDDRSLNSIMVRSWTKTCAMTALHVAGPHLDNMAIESFMGSLPRLQSEGRFWVDNHAPYDAYKTAEDGDKQEGGIELVKLRGTSSHVHKKRNSASVGSLVSNMPKIAKFI